MPVEIRQALTDADYEAWRQVRLAVLPGEQALAVAQLRAQDAPVRLLLLAFLDGELAGSGLADRSDTGQGFVAPRVIPACRGRGVGSALLAELVDHVSRHGFEKTSAHVNGADTAAVGFAERRGFVEVDREVEQVRAIGPDEEDGPDIAGIEFTTVGARPELLDAAYELGSEGYADLALTVGKVDISREQWLRDEATLPGGSVVALADGEIVGFAGLTRWEGEPTLAENGLTVVRRAWRGRGLAPALKQRQIAWAATNGIRELVTWTQRGNQNMQRVNHRLGYVIRDESLTMHRPLP